MINIKPNSFACRTTQKALVTLEIPLDLRSRGISRVRDNHSCVVLHARECGFMYGMYSPEYSANCTIILYLVGKFPVLSPAVNENIFHSDHAILIKNEFQRKRDQTGCIFSTYRFLPFFLLELDSLTWTWQFPSSTNARWSMRSRKIYISSGNRFLMRCMRSK